MNLGEVEKYYREQAATPSMEDTRIPLSAQLKKKLEYHNGQIELIQNTLNVLKTNPDIEKLLFLLGKVH